MKLSLLGWRYRLPLITEGGCICADCQEEDGGCDECPECIAVKEFLAERPR